MSTRTKTKPSIDFSVAVVRADISRRLAGSPVIVFEPIFDFIRKVQTSEVEARQRFAALAEAAQECLLDRPNPERVPPSPGAFDRYDCNFESLMVWRLRDRELFLALQQDPRSWTIFYGWIPNDKAGVLDREID